MLSIAKRLFILPVMLVLCNSFTGTHHALSRQDISREQAIQLAEEFIKINGYTKAPADTSKLSFEFLYDSGESIKSILKKRHNSLQPKAYCIVSKKDGWDIGFISTRVKLGQLDSLQKMVDLPGKGVGVNLTGTEIKMNHKEPIFSLWEKIYPGSYPAGN